MSVRKKEKYIVILVTAPKVGEAKKLARLLLRKKEVGCVNIVENAASLFRWEGKVQEEKEVLLLIKSRQKHFKDIVKTIKSCHSYSVPEIIALPVIAGDENYLKWLGEVVKG